MGETQRCRNAKLTGDGGGAANVDLGSLFQQVVHGTPPVCAGDGLGQVSAVAGRSQGRGHQCHKELLDAIGGADEKGCVDALMMASLSSVGLTFRMSGWGGGGKDGVRARKRTT
jgi:hypothetical protein